ncbi:MAG: tRNA (adenosine(37)-N6)-threonylcarbamoyltransferase complex ATPase subunit type 1 TsaE [Flavobacteriales bacterium]|nr:tRNA (adenosine(37)-N6)-threonylcarbamoyltransferase complex ATPase subunit type 1 TsaE [Flavobacteriales bacterium]|tara:strand:- start:2484 stop:2894 length:411 start_codon:yes stop_codon:yes gene_type:complete
MKWVCKELSQIDKISSEILMLSKKKIAFHGNMGVGKTTLIKSICKMLNVIDVVKSPTFSIVNEYISEINGKVYHFDFYRIIDKQEVIDIGVQSYFDSSAYCFVEWPTMINDLTFDFDHVYIELENNNRIIKLVSHD